MLDVIPQFNRAFSHYAARNILHSGIGNLIYFLPRKQIRYSPPIFICAVPVTNYIFQEIILAARFRFQSKAENVSLLSLSSLSQCFIMFARYLNGTPAIKCSPRKSLEINVCLPRKCHAVSCDDEREREPPPPTTIASRRMSKGGGVEFAAASSI
jgi:hypothetical protein